MNIDKEKLKLLKELEEDIIYCRLEAGDGGDNTDMVNSALETLEKLKKSFGS